MRDGLAEGDVAQAVDAQAVDLADDAPLGIDHDGAAVDHVPDTLINQVVAEEPLLDGLFDMAAEMCSAPSRLAQ